MKKLGMLIEFFFLFKCDWKLGSYSEKLVEDRILKILSMERNSVETVKTIISEELIKIKEEPEIFANLLKSCKIRCW